MTAAGFSEKYLEKISKTILFLCWGFGLLSLQLIFPYWPAFITDLFSGELANYFFYSAVLALSLTFPVFISSLVFIKGTQEFSKKFPVDQSSGFLNACACLGNILGMIGAVLLASHLWENLFFGTALVVLFIGIFLIAKSERKHQEASYGVVALILFAVISFRHDQASNLFNNRFDKENRPSQIISEVHSDAFSSIAILEDPFDQGGLARHYIVDGHRSHNIERGTESLVGLIGRRYFPHAPKKSMVIGVGTGQTSWGVTAISEKTDLVEISPTVLDNLKIFKSYNNDLVNDPRAKVNLVDGMTFLKECPANSYDLIVNTATYPGNFNAAKLYTKEFVALAKNCLTDNGVYETYFDGSTVTNRQELADFLAPIQEHFKYIDIINGNYPILMAYNQERPLTTGGWETFLSDSDARFYEQGLKNKSAFNLECNQIYRKIPFYDGGRMNTLDQSILEAHSIRNIIKTNYLKTFYLFMDYSGLPFSTDCFQ
ncbi:hypothetical protein [Bdellovibrio sp. HCB209]|uniref:spermine/spermidine synthase domain-containing protein n=1 Tax=Bdellovibrio sp. HCB209 TaxID=3394354 RepID=UPI0039B41CCE